MCLFMNTIIYEYIKINKQLGLLMVIKKTYLCPKIHEISYILVEMVDLCFPCIKVTLFSCAGTHQTALNKKCLVISFTVVTILCGADC